MSSETRRRSAVVAVYQRKRSRYLTGCALLRKGRMYLWDVKKKLTKTGDDLKYLLNSLCEIVAEVQGSYKDSFAVKLSCGKKLLLGCHSKVDKKKLVAGTRVALHKNTPIITRILPQQVDPFVYNVLHEDQGNVSYSALGGLSDQIQQLRESIELPLTNPEILLKVGVKAPKVVTTAIVDKYVGQSVRLLREIFRYARDHQPCIIFMDEIDAIGGRRLSEGTSADRAIQKTLTELLYQMDEFDQLGKIKFIMATNRPDVLDPALLRPGRIDRKIEIPLPNEHSRMKILKIHSVGITKHGEIDFEAVVKLAEGFNGADLRNVCTEAGLFAIRAERDCVLHEDFIKAVRKLKEAKKLESSAHYNVNFGKEY